MASQSRSTEIVHKWKEAPVCWHSAMINFISVIFNIQEPVDTVSRVSSHSD